MAVINQKRIAEQLGISIATVSRALRNSSAVNEQTRERVLSMAEELGYELRPTVLDLGRQIPADTPINVLIHDDQHSPDGMPSTFPLSFVAGMNRRAKECGISLSIHHYLKQEQAAPDYSFLKTKDGVGACILVYRFPEEIVQDLAATMPCVTLAHHCPQSRADHVDTDAIAGIATAVNRLNDLGHQKIGFVAHRPEVSYARARFAAFVQALCSAGLEYIPQACINTYSKDRNWMEQAEDVMRSRETGITAWVCVNDLTAYHLYANLASRGVSVPADVSIVGYDGDTPPPGCPPLTTVRVPFEEMGYVAVDTALRRLGGYAGPPISLQLHGTFIPGETIARPNFDKETT